MSRFAFSAVVWWVGGLLVTALAQAEAPRRIGSEFQVNTATTNAQFYTKAAMDADGDFVVSWVSSGQDGEGNGVFAQRYDSSGVKLATEFQVNSFTNGSQNRTAVAMAPDGRFVIAWQSEAQDLFSYGVFARRFSAAGVAEATEFRANTFIIGSQASPKVAVDAKGEFVIAWDSNPQDGFGYGVFAQRFDSEGTPLGFEIQVSGAAAVDQNRPDVAKDQAGGFVVVWQQGTGNATRVFARRFDAAGASIASEFQVSEFTTAGQAFPDVAMNSPGEFVVTWRGRYQDNPGAEGGIFARRYDAAGAAVGHEMQINTYTIGQQVLPQVGIDDTGDFVVTWRADAQDGSGYGVFARSLDVNGTSAATELQVTTYTLGNQNNPAIGMAPQGRFVIAWQSTDQDGAAEGVFAQRFAPISVLDIDGDGANEPLTDGILVLRFHFGFTGNTLIADAVNTDACTRCDAAAIEGYLNTLR